MSIDWTPFDTELRAAWLDGQSGGEIAKALSERHHLPINRSMTIGRIMRLGLMGQRKIGAADPREGTALAALRRERAVQKARRETPKRALPEVLVIAPKPAPEITGPLPLQALGLHACRWPIGDPRDADFLFCACHCDDGQVYCGDHRRIAYRVEAPNERRRQQRALGRLIRRAA